MLYLLVCIMFKNFIKSAILGCLSIAIFQINSSTISYPESIRYPWTTEENNVINECMTLYQRAIHKDLSETEFLKIDDYIAKLEDLIKEYDVKNYIHDFKITRLELEILLLNSLKKSK